MAAKKPAKKSGSARKSTPKKGPKKRPKVANPPRVAAPSSPAPYPSAPVDNWPSVFLSVLASTANVTEASLRAGVDRSTPYARRQDDQEFAAAWKQAIAMGVDALELEARRRAMHGVERPVFHQGVVCGRIREFSDTLMIFLLKSHRPGKFRDNVRHEHMGKGGKPIEQTVTVVVKRDRNFFGRGPTAGTDAPPDTDPGKPGPV
jgi:hypothetical protein